MDNIISKGGPENEDYNDLTNIILHFYEELKNKKLEVFQIDELMNSFDFLKDPKSIMGHILLKPYGYAGNFHIIDRIYTNDYSKEYLKWDKFSLSSSAAQAVRNRKDYFKYCAKTKLKNGDLLLNIASGPARDLKEFYDENPNIDIETTCVEMENKAITHAHEINEKHLNKIEFIQKNIFRYSPNKKFDLIWSSGLFDYFDDRLFVKLIKKFRDWLSNDGEIIIGNFNEETNPSRAYMELVGKWYLNHRSESQLIKLVEEAGYPDAKISVGREPENVNLFLHLKK